MLFNAPLRMFRLLLVLVLIVGSSVTLANTSAATPPQITAEPFELIYSAIKNNTQTRTLTIHNTGETTLQITSATIGGTNAGKWTLLSGPTPSGTIAGGGSATFSIRFVPGSTVGTLQAYLRIISNDPITPTLDVGLYGLSANGDGGNNEPPFKRVVDTLGYPIDVGGTGLIIGTTPDPIGDEVRAPMFVKAGAGEITITPVARYSPNERLPYGFYTRSGNTPNPTTLAAIAVGQHQTLLPQIEAGGATSFDPGTTPFGIFVESISFGRKSYTDDALNTGIPHAARVYPLVNRQGTPLPGTYMVAFEDAANGDYQDYVFVLSNVRPSTAQGGCIPWSTLPCADVPVQLPYVLEWNSDHGELADRNGTGTGWTMADPPSARLTADNPVTYSAVRGYEPRNLAVDPTAGTFTITATKGIQYKSGNNGNSLINGMGVGVSAQGQTLSIETTLLAPPPGSGKAEQGGLWFGLDEDHYVKLVVVSIDATTSKVQLLYEDGAANATEINSIDAPLNAAPIAIISGPTIRLRLEIDAAASTATAFYKLDAAPEVELGSFAVNAALFAGIDHDNSAATSAISFAGVFASVRNRTATPVLQRYTFDRFSIKAIQPISGLSLVSDTPTALGNLTTFTATVTTGSDLTYVWDFGDGTAVITTTDATITHTYPASGTWTATVTASNTISNASADTSVLVEAAVNGLSLVSDAPTALGSSTTFTATASGDNLSYAWNFGDGSAVITTTSATVTHTYPASGTWTATVTAFNTISSASADTSVLIEAALNSLNVISDSPTALGNTTTFTATATGDNLSYVWDFGDGSTVIITTSATITHTYGTTGTFSVAVTASNAVSSDSATTIVLVEAAIDGLVLVNDSPTVVGEATTLIASVAEGDNLSYVWDFGDGSTVIITTSATITHTYPVTGTFTATVTATNAVSSASATSVIMIVAAEQPISGLQVSNDGPTVLGDMTRFTATVSTGTHITYTWNFGDGSPVITTSTPLISHTYGLSGTYAAVVTATNPLGTADASTTATVVAAEQAISGLQVSNDGPTILGAPTIFTATVATGTNVVYTWDFGDGSTTITTTNTTISHTYAISSTFTATVTATNPLGSQQAQTEVQVQSSTVPPTQHRLYLPFILSSAANR